MRTLNRSLREGDPGLLPTLARVWDVDTENLLDTGEIIDAITSAMLNPDNTERVWNTLSEEQRGRLFILIGAPSAKMTMNKAEMMFGKIRKLGAAQIDRERPDKNPTSIAEALYYRGLISIGYEQVPTGAQQIIYIPDDLLGVLPTHKTQYEHLEEDEDVFPDEDEDGEAPVGIEQLDEVNNARHADTSVVDDLTTLLAYLQLQAPMLDVDARIQQFEDYRLAQTDRNTVMPQLLTHGDERLTFLVGLALSADLLEVQSGRAITKRAEARRWLAASRAEQVRTLVEAWRESHLYRDLWHVPGLHPEPGGKLDSYDPTAVRRAVLGFIADLAPSQAWWSIDSFVETVKETDPDFQRPGGDYESWYIRNEAGDYLEGFESWDAVEGALLEYYLFGPMHWLGLADVADDAARLTAYGRAALNLGPWPTPPDPQDKVVVKEDGTLLVSRKVSRIDRFQVARFTTWISPGDPYTYKLDARGVSRAATQGINTSHISAFISKQLSDAPLPPTIARLLESWRSGPATSVSLERLLVLRTTSPDVMDRIWEAPGLRRYLGARLGEMAVIVRPDQWEALRDALGEQGIEVEVSG